MLFRTKFLLFDLKKILLATHEKGISNYKQFVLIDT